MCLLITLYLLLIPGESSANTYEYFISPKDSHYKVDTNCYEKGTYHYKIDQLKAYFNKEYGRNNWDFCPILAIPYEEMDKLKLPSVFHGTIISVCNRGIVWLNPTKDTSYVVIKYWENKKLKYEVYWFGKK